MSHFSILWGILGVWVLPAEGVQAVEVEVEVGLQAGLAGEELGPCPACAAQQHLQERSWVLALHGQPSSTSQVPRGSRMDGPPRLFLLLGQKSAAGGVNCTVCYLHPAVLALEALPCCSHLGLGARSRLGPELVAVWG